MVQLAEVKAHAIRLFARGRYQHALRLCDAIVAAAPLDFEARIKVADCLVALEHPIYAAPVYRAVADYVLASGHPLAALVVARVLEAMNRVREEIIDDFVARYGAQSQHTNSFAARVSLPPPETPVAPPDLRVPPPEDYWRTAADRAASCTERFTDYPAAVHPLPLLSLLSEDALRRVLSTLIVGRVPDGQMVIRQGEPGHSFFFVATGAVRVFTTNDRGQQTELARLHENAVFGEMALIGAQPRSASVQVVGEADVLEATRDSLAALSGELAPVAVAMHKFTRERMLENLMATNQLFKPFDRAQRLDLLRRFTSHEVDKGARIVQEGDEARGLFVVLSGEAEVSKRDASGQRQRLSTVRSGDVFGELSILRSGRAAATVTALCPSVVLFLAHEYVARMVKGVPQIKQYLEALADDRSLEIKLAQGGAPSGEDSAVLI